MPFAELRAFTNANTDAAGTRTDHLASDKLSVCPSGLHHAIDNNNIFADFGNGVVWWIFSAEVADDGC